MDSLRQHLLAGQVIPAHPLALTAERRLDEERQRGLTRYYLNAGAGGIAVGVHTTQFAIREHGLFEPVLSLAAETARAALAEAPRPFTLISGAIGRTDQAVSETKIAKHLGYDAVLLSLGAWKDEADDAILRHSRTVAKILPLFGFYLQPAIGGRVLGYEFWRRFAEIPELVAIKIAPFNRYQTLDVVRAVVDAGREDVALYTGNDDNILVDLLTTFPGNRRIVGGLLGQWAVWTRGAVEQLNAIKKIPVGGPISAEWLTRAAALTDSNAAVFDPSHGFAGCIPGIHEVLRRQGLLDGTWCLHPDEVLSPGQSAALDRVMASYPELADGS
jgi:dihydrodipicolinate synthase/N-acetylneuraminate lyase